MKWRQHSEFNRELGTVIFRYDNTSPKALSSVGIRAPTTNRSCIELRKETFDEVGILPSGICLIQTSPLPWLLKNHATQVIFHTLIHTFCLAIWLWVIGRAKPQFHLQCFEEGLPHVTCEYPVSIRDYWLWQSIPLKNIIHESMRDWLYCIRVSKGNEMRIFSEPVHHQQYDFFAQWFGKTLKEIQGDVSPSRSR